MPCFAKEPQAPKVNNKQTLCHPWGKTSGLSDYFYYVHVCNLPAGDRGLTRLQPLMKQGVMHC